ncbi:MAG TPA: hypothetical protein VMT03_03010 [Polyangia bacterium]|nr:hypothetical protein [Polyangia bacterium]
MSPADARAALLLAECRRDWDAVQAHAARARAAKPAARAAEAALVALSLHHAYQVFETILARIEHALGLPERAGASWHTALLADAAQEIPGLRPPLFPRQALSEWDALLRFRHFLRHAYVVDLDPDKLTANRERLDRAVAQTDSFLAIVLAALASTPG